MILNYVWTFEPLKLFFMFECETFPEAKCAPTFFSFLKHSFYALQLNHKQKWCLLVNTHMHSHVSVWWRVPGIFTVFKSKLQVWISKFPVWIFIWNTQTTGIASDVKWLYFAENNQKKPVFLCFSDFTTRTHLTSEVSEMQALTPLWGGPSWRWSWGLLFHF